MTDLVVVALIGMLFWPIAGIALIWADIHPKTPIDVLATLIAGTVGGWFMAIFVGIAVYYGFRVLFRMWK